MLPFQIGNPSWSIPEIPKNTFLPCACASLTALQPGTMKLRIAQHHKALNPVAGGKVCQSLA